MDEAGTLDWLNRVWNRRPGTLLKKPSMLVWDMFRAHHTEEVKKKAKQIKTTLAVIPGGLTSVLQPLDVCLNKPFKDRVRKMWSEWMISGDVKLTKGGNMMKPDLDLVAKWVKDAWDSIPTEMVARSFLKCCISNSLDGTEDDALYNDELEIDDEVEEDPADDVYDDNPLLNQGDIDELFNESESETEFEGF